MMSHAGRMRLLMAGAGLMLMAGPAFSLDGADLVAKLNAAMGIPGAPLAAQTIDVRGSTVTLRGATYKPVETEPAVNLGDITLEGVEEDAGGYVIEKVLFPNVNAAEDNTTVTISDISMSNVTVPADTTGDSLASVLLYEEASTGPMTVTVDGKEVFSVASSVSTTDVADDQSAVGFAIDVQGIRADLSTVEDVKSRDALQSLGLTALNGSMTMSGSWQAEEGVVDLEEYVFDFADVGTLSMALSFSGYTMEFVRAAQEATKAMDTNASKESQDAAGLAMLGLMQRLTFNSAEISFQDAGITNRALDYAGKEQGVSGENMAQMLKAMTPMMLAQYNVPKLQNMVSEAVNTYLDNPGNFTISAKPENPVPFPMIMGAAMGAPNTLPDVLGVTVEANRRQ
ncbi:membrane protein [Pseudorhizobium endolithicum]|uniref:Membrane protein n=2 Tax=Pseudorhizobium endolithicum TaxID=1191678 RepID=A0ABM8PJK2_9HYPH|nr:membrane protein [Pseudorhizobium endolithicum]